MFSLGCVFTQPWRCSCRGAQWGAFSKFAGLDAIVIRDGFTSYGNYRRSGPFGVAGAPDAETAQQFIDSVKALFRETKLGAPSLSVIGYSQASSAVGEWRTGATPPAGSLVVTPCHSKDLFGAGMTDVEGIVAEGEPTKFHQVPS